MSSRSLRMTLVLPLMFCIGLLLIGNWVAANAESEAARLARVVQATNDFSKAERYELRPGGAATSFKKVNRDAFSHPSANMSFERELDFRVGDGIFKKIWVSSPSSTTSSDGLGPLFNARSCQRCHLKDGRGSPPADGERATSLLIRMSIPPQNEDDQHALEGFRKSVISEPSYGGQIQTFSIQGHLAEADVSIAYHSDSIELADGTIVNLRVPAYELVNLKYGPLHKDTMLSARVAPPMIGVGLLEAVSPDDILKNADPDDENGDGISGRPNWIWSEEKNKVMLGRFGWKAGQPSVSQQVAGAFKGDIGISTPLFSQHYGECTESQIQCRNAIHGGTSDPDGTEANTKMMALLNFYSRNLAVPARRNVDDTQVLEGKRLFYQANCIGCHVPKFVTARDAINEEQSFQLIWPYTDLLLHDMGEGLADNRPEGVASGREWRTPPLWGIGLTEVVSGHTTLLHDGRARNILEAILWHGGEAEHAKQQVVNMSADERSALLAFLNSL